METSIQFLIDDDLKRDFEAKTSRSELSLSEFVDDFLREFVDKTKMTADGYSSTPYIEKIIQDAETMHKKI